MDRRRNRRWSRFVLVALLGASLACLSSCRELMKAVFGNAAPVISSLDLAAPNPRTGSAVTVLATASDADGDPLSYTWILKSAPSGSGSSLIPAGSSASFTPDAAGSYTVQCTVGDGSVTAVRALDIPVTAAAAADTAAPTVGTVTPAAGATGVAVGTNVTAAFSEEMDAATVGATTFLLLDGTAPVAASVAYAAATRTATLDPAADLAPSRAYTAKVTTGAKDAAGNALAADFAWTFTTAAPPSAVDYDVTGEVFPSSGVVAAAFSGSFQAKNRGTVDGTTTLAWKVYRSADGTIDAGDATVQQGTLAPLAAGVTSPAVGYAGTWPSAPGDYRLIVELTEGSDADASNNVSVSPAIPVAAIVDYAVTSPAFPVTGTVGGAISGNFKVTNGGTADGSAAVAWTVYASSDATVSAGDVTVASGSRAALPAGTTSPSIAFTGTWPSTAGTYHLIVALTATDEGNAADNALASTAIVVTDAGRIVRAGQTGSIMYSDDGGVTWTPSTVTPATTVIFKDLATNGQGLWVVVGEDRKVYHSVDDAVTWSEAAGIAGSAYANDLTGVAYGNGGWVVSGAYASGEVTTLYSADGMNWALKGIGTPIGLGLDAVTYDAANDRWVASNLGNGYGYYSASAAAAWGNGVINTGKFRSVTYGGGRVIGVGAGVASYLTAGTTWTSATTLPYAGSTSAYYEEVEYDGSLVWVATGYRGSYNDALLVYSTNGGMTWTSAASPGTTGIVMRCVTYDPKSGRFVAGGTDGAVKYSEDGGNTWTDVSTGTTLDYYAIQAGP